MTRLSAQLIAVIDQRLGAVEPALDALVEAHRADVETQGPTDALAGLCVILTSALAVPNASARQVKARDSIIDMFAVAVSRLAAAGGQ